MTQQSLTLAKRRPRALSIFSSIVLAIAGTGWLIQGLRAWEFFETMTGAYTLGMATFCAFGHRLDRKAPARPCTTVNDPRPLSMITAQDQDARVLTVMGEGRRFDSTGASPTHSFRFLTPTVNEVPCSSDVDRQLSGRRGVGDSNPATSFVWPRLPVPVGQVGDPPQDAGSPDQLAGDRYGQHQAIDPAVGDLGAKPGEESELAHQQDEGRSLLRTGQNLCIVAQQVKQYRVYECELDNQRPASNGCKPENHGYCDAKYTAAWLVSAPYRRLDHVHS
jgi:hypothetical protein